MEKRVGVLWYRNDLRLHDNEALTDAIQQVDEIYPVYVLDDRFIHGKTSKGFRKTGLHRAKFLLESLADLQKSLREKGSDLFIYSGKTEDILFDVVQKTKASWVFCNRERTREEVEIQEALEEKLWTIGREIRFYRGKMLLYTADLPFPVTHTPDTFSQFRKEVERIVEVREPLPIPNQINTGPILQKTTVPSLDDLGYSLAEYAALKGFSFTGGETNGLNRLKYYLWETDLVANYKNSRNNLLGEDFSSKFSAYLSMGCLSPKMIYREVKNYEQERKKNKSTYWLVFELLWRDYFRFIGKKYKSKIFSFNGINGAIPPRKGNDELFEKWISGTTGIPFIDANMREIEQTGYMSNRGRQNVASFLINDLKVDWTWGAQYFESILVDYDPCSNYGNWNYLAGVGTDPREDRYFKIFSQALRYDPNGDYVREWLPELSMIPTKEVHFPRESMEGKSVPDCYQNPIVELEN